ncbi:MAG: FAD-dependent oxidoreductase [Firmicutes bacterium]|nr:FAD-dependent oxidoreductase [Bacillota bacterium]
MLAKVVVVGGGWAGCAAAAAAAKMGMETILIEKVDHLLGAGYMAGFTNTNARCTGILEGKALGVPEIFETAEAAMLYSAPKVPCTENGFLYNVFSCERNVAELLERLGVEVRLQSRVVDVVMRGDRMDAVKTSDGDLLKADAFVDGTGSAGPEPACVRYGWGCVMCLYKCPAYGGRVSITERSGVKEGMAKRRDGGYGAVSNAVQLVPDSIDPAVREEHKKQGGCVLIPAPEGIGDPEIFRKIRTQEFYDTTAYDDYLVSVDMGLIKFMSRPWVKLNALRKIDGFRNVAFHDPQAGDKGNAVRFLALAPCDTTLKVRERPNLFCGGEKLGFVGVADATVTGLLAGHNAARAALGIPLLELPRTTAIGASIAWVQEQYKTEEGWYKKYSMVGTGGVGAYLKEQGLYTTDPAVVRARIQEAGLLGVFSEPR